MKTAVARCTLLLTALALLPFSASAGAVYVTAHQDDWQLRIGSNAYSDIVAGGSDRTVFIYVTAGNAQHLGGDSNAAWWAARERGARASMARPQGLTCDAPGNSSVAVYNSKNLARFSCGSVTAVFIRLPDYLGQYSSALDAFPQTAVDGTATYATRAELVATIAAIVQAEMPTVASMVWLNAIGDSSVAGHRDHVNVASLVVDAANLLKCTTRFTTQQLLSIAWWAGTGSQETAMDAATFERRYKTLMWYEYEMLKTYPDLSGSTLLEPLIISRGLILAEHLLSTALQQCP